VLNIRAHTAERFLQLGTGSLVNVETKAGYGYSSGTSMATPYVAGVAARLWRSCPGCTNQDIEGCLLQASVDLGPTGKDVKYGYGLVQADATFLCLRDTVKCCGVSETILTNTTDATGALAPSPAPIHPSVPSPAPVERSRFINIVGRLSRPSSVVASTKSVDDHGKLR
jgi:Subtilase family